MPRRREIEAAIAAYNDADPETLLPPDAARLLSVMFRRSSVCQRSVAHLAAEASDTIRLVKRLLRKVFGPGRAVPLDRNAKARIAAYSRAWDRLHRQPGQRGGALGRAALDVLGALLWVFHNARSGGCFPSYETIAGKAGCARSTVAEAIKALEFAGVLTWQNRIVRIRERCRDLFGRVGWRWRVVRTSNAYVLIDPASKSDQRTGTPDQEDSKPLQASAVDTNSPLERALARFAAAVAGKKSIEQEAGG